MSGKSLLALIMPSGVARLAAAARDRSGSGRTDQQSSMFTY